MRVVAFWVAYVLAVTLLGLCVTAEHWNADERPTILVSGCIALVGGVAIGLILGQPRPRGVAPTLIGASLGIGVYISAAVLLGAGQALFLGFPIAALILLYQLAWPGNK